MKDKRIGVVGVGGVGGYLATMLSREYPHVTVVARGARGEAIRKNGLVLHSDFRADIIARPERVVSSSTELGEQDYLFICVKNYSLEEACRELAGAVGGHTVILPVMNGVDPGERVRAILGRGTVIDSLIYIIAFANPDYSIMLQGDFADIRFGLKNADEGQRELLGRLSDLFTGAGIRHRICEDIELDIWRKYILNCAYNVLTAYYDNTIGQLRSDPVKAGEYEALVMEAYQVGCAKGVHLAPSHAKAIITRFYKELAADATSSLQRDIRAGKPAEIETFSGYLVKEAGRLGIDVPVTERMYRGLQGIRRA
ncbi:MAG: 2-dehydropantoate 2-reductase [Clostridiales bacterium]|nr:2-dehydropantoate 2-reductase [Clostridiales bacterium]